MPRAPRAPASIRAPGPACALRRRWEFSPRRLGRSAAPGPRAASVRCGTDGDAPPSQVDPVHEHVDLVVVRTVWEREASSISNDVRRRRPRVLVALAVLRPAARTHKSHPSRNGMIAFVRATSSTLARNDTILGSSGHSAFIESLGRPATSIPAPVSSASSFFNARACESPLASRILIGIRARLISLLSANR